MTLEEAIKHAEEMAKCGGRRCGRMYHAQLAMWLKELQTRRLSTPCSACKFDDMGEEVCMRCPAESMR